MSNPELELAQRIIVNTGMHLFLTGKAGTGKTTFLKQLKQQSPKRMIVLAPTGIAAINAEGMTIHSFFQLPFAPYIPNTVFHAKDTYRYKFGKEKIRIIQSLDLLVIDEISMVRADLLDAMDAVLRRYRHSVLPFGGVQLLFIGDMQQLAPVVKPEEWELLAPYYTTPYFFSSRALSQTEYATIELKQNYRQTDLHFLQLLNNIRDNKLLGSTIAELNKRYIPNFLPPASEKFIRLTTHNLQAQSINEYELSQLPSPAFVYKATISGKFPELSYPTDEVLTLKRGAQVMFIKNDRSTAKRYFNGMIGEITDIDDHGFSIKSKECSEEIRVQPETWENSRYVLDKESMEIKEEVEGTFVQFPVRLAWAITIHKSQGLTFTHAIIDAHYSFAHGQVYVALSRCRTLQGLVLSSPLTEEAFICDNTIRAFTSDIAEHMPQQETIQGWERKYCLTLVDELFSFSALSLCLEDVRRIVAEYFQRMHPNTMQKLNTLHENLEQRVVDVAARFKLQYTRLIGQQPKVQDISPALQERLRQGAEYFCRELAPLLELSTSLSLPTDNKIVQSRMTDAVEKLRQQVSFKTDILQFVKEEGFHADEYLHRKTTLLLQQENGNDGKPAKVSKKQKQTSAENSGKGGKAALSADISDTVLYALLTEWRKNKSKEMHLPAYCILQQNAVIGLANLRPTTLPQLLSVPYLGKVTADKYGEEILGIISRYLQERGD